MDHDPRDKMILLVDDEENLLKVVRDFLVFKGYQVISAVDGEEALRRVRSTNPDLIILDILLPKMNGFDVCRLLKIDEASRRIPVVMLTSKGEPADISTGYELGADIYFVKPVNLESLLVTIEKLLVKTV